MNRAQCIHFLVPLLRDGYTVADLTAVKHSAAVNILTSICFYTWVRVSLGWTLGSGIAEDLHLNLNIYNLPKLTSQLDLFNHTISESR